MTLKLPVVVLAFTIALPALADSADTVDWYVAHPDERKAQAARCDNDPGELQGTPDCVNAKEAGRKAVEVEAREKLDDAGDRVKDAYHDLTK